MTTGCGNRLNDCGADLCLRAVGHSEPLVNFLQVKFDRVIADVQPVGNLSVCQSFRGQRTGSSSGRNKSIDMTYTFATPMAGRAPATP